MDLYRAIRHLYEQRAKLDRAIATLEELERTAAAAATAPKKRRGRKSMDTAARQEVSDRMKRYWAARRSQRKQEAQL